MTTNCHIKHANLKISKGIRILTKLRRYLSKCVLRTLFYAFVEIHIRGVATNSGYGEGRGGVRFKSGPFLYRKYEHGIKMSNVSSPC